MLIPDDRMAMRYRHYQHLASIFAQAEGLRPSHLVGSTVNDGRQNIYVLGSAR